MSNPSKLKRVDESPRVLLGVRRLFCVGLDSVRSFWVGGGMAAQKVNSSTWSAIEPAWINQ